jgi:hypothetical protein
VAFTSIQCEVILIVPSHFSTEGWIWNPKTLGLGPVRWLALLRNLEVAPTPGLQLVLCREGPLPAVALCDESLFHLLKLLKNPKS